MKEHDAKNLKEKQLKNQERLEYDKIKGSSPFGTDSVPMYNSSVAKVASRNI